MMKLMGNTQFIFQVVGTWQQATICPVKTDFLPASLQLKWVHSTCCVCVIHAYTCKFLFLITFIFQICHDFCVRF